MSEYFILSSERLENDDARLLSYSGAIKGGKMVLTLKVEAEGFWMHRIVSALEAIQKAHKKQLTPKPAAPKRQAKAKPLALPAPHLALPGPAEGGR